MEVSLVELICPFVKLALLVQPLEMLGFLQPVEHRPDPAPRLRSSERRGEPDNDTVAFPNGFNGFGTTGATNDLDLDPHCRHLANDKQTRIGGRGTLRDLRYSL